MSRLQKAIALLLLVLLGWVEVSCAETAAVTAGLNYLSAAQNPDGSWGSAASRTDRFRTTAEVVETLRALGLGDTAGCTRAEAWLQEQAAATTDYLAERMRVLGVSGQDGDLLVSYRDSGTGAWGGYQGYQANSLDTVLALDALRAAGFSNEAILRPALSSLLSAQNPDGGFGFRAGDPSGVYMTAMVSIGLQAFPRTASIARAVSGAAGFLALHQNGDGGFGSSPSTPYETALATLALMGSISDLSVIGSGVAYLTSVQQTDGSFEEDPYATALALRVFGNVKPNLTVTSEGIGFSPSAPVVGETITLSVLIKNSGPAPAHTVVVHFSYGNPSAGGVLIGQTAIDSIEPYSSAQTSVSWALPDAGTRAVFVAVDPTDMIDELSETDNVGARTFTAATLPDLSLTASDLIFDPAVPQPGDSVTLTATVRNTGETAAANVPVAIYLGDPNLGGTLLGSATIGSLAAGDSVGIVTPLNFSGAGTYGLFVVADRENGIAEADETNNAASKTLRIGSGAFPDLAVSGEEITFSPEDPAEGSTVVVHAAVTNLGEGQAENVAVRFYRGNPLSGGEQIGSDCLIPVIQARSGATVSVTWDTSGHPGSNAICVVVDPEGSLFEPSRENNTACKPLPVALTHGPDLTVGSKDIGFLPATPTAGESVTLSAVVTNTGSTDAGNVPIEISLGNPEKGGALILASPVIASLPQGQSQVVQATWNTADYAGDYELYVRIDPFGEIPETDETNNLAKALLHVSGIEGPDLLAAGLDTAGMQTDLQTLEVSGEMRVSIRNKGNQAAADPFEITVFDDRNGNGMLDEPADRVLGTITSTGSLGAGALETVGIPVSGQVKFRDALLSVMVDSGNAIEETDETNNLKNTGEKCIVQPPAGSFNPVEKWKWTGSTVLPSYRQVMQTPVVARLADTNGDGTIDQDDLPLVVFVTWYSSYYSDGVLRAIRGDTGQEVFAVSDSRYRTDPSVTPAIGDIDGDGLPEIVAAKSGGGLLAFGHDGSFKWSSRTPSATANGAPSIADLDHDGKAEIIFGATVLNSDGSQRWQGTGGSGHNMWGYLSAVADIDLDGYPEVVAGNTVYRRDGSILWRNTSVGDGYTGVADFDGDGYPEVVLVTYGKIYLLTHTGQLVWGPYTIPGSGNYGNPAGVPTIADFNGDGSLEIGVAAGQYYVVVKANMEKLWTSTVRDMSSSFTGSSVFDFDGDGQAEVVYNDEQKFRIYRGSDGIVLFELANTSGTLAEYPVVVDVDNDNRAEIVFIANGVNYGIRVFEDANDTWVNTRKIWNQHSYHITNVNDDGTIPRYEPNNWETYNNYRCNSLLPEVALATPDFTVSYLSVDPSGYPASVVLAARIGNGGGIAGSELVSVSFYDGEPMRGGTLIGTTQTAGAIERGAFEDVTFTWTGPAEGTHTLFVMADPDGAIKECRRDNNAASASIRLGTAPPQDLLADLSIAPSDLTLIPPDALEGQPAAVHAVVHNLGALGAAEVTLSFFDGDPQQGGTLIGSVTKAFIDAGASASAEITWNTFGQSGRNYLHVVVDPEDLIAESNESNNATLIPVEVAPPAKPDLAVSSSDITFSNWNPEEGEPLGVSVRVHNLGTETSDVAVSLYDGDPQSGGTLLSQTTLARLLPFGGTAELDFDLDTLGRAGTHSFTVVLDPENRIDESTKANNTAWSALTIGSTGLASSVSTDKPAYGADETVQVVVSLENLLGSERSGTLSLQVVDSSDTVVSGIVASEPIGMAASEKKALSFTWNTGRTLSASYKVTCLYVENGHIASRSEAPLIIVPVKAVSSKIASDKTAYAANRPVTLTSTIVSGSPNTILENLTARIAIANGSGEVLFSEERAIPSLGRGALLQLKSNWNTGGVAKGSCTASLEVLEQGTLLSSATASFEILGTSVTGSGLSGTLVAVPASVLAGEQVTLDWTVANRGNEALNGLTLAVLLLDPETGEVKQTLATTLDLALNASASGSLSGSTLNFKPGTALAVLQASSASFDAPRTLASAPFKVEAGLEASKTIPDRAQLLVWVNDTRCTKKGGKGAVRIDLLEKMLREAAVSYRVVTEARDFERELRSPSYTDLFILGDRHPIEDHFADELREQVYSGKGLLASLYLKHGTCGDASYETLLGLSFKGNLPGESHTIELLESFLATAGTLGTRGKALKVEADDPAGVLAWFGDPGKKRCETGKAPAILSNTYGLGKTLFFAFDLGASLGDDTYGSLASLVKNAITFLHKPREEGVFPPDALVPVEVSVRSLGGAFDLELTESYPDTVKIFDPESGWVSEAPWSRTVTLGAGEEKTLLYYALTPELAGTATLLTDVNSTAEGASRLWATLTAEITVEKDIPELLDVLSSKLAAIEASGKNRREIAHVRELVERVRQREVANTRDLEKNIDDLLKALDHLMAVSGIDCSSVRLLLDDLLQAEEGRLYWWALRAAPQNDEKIPLRLPRH